MSSGVRPPSVLISLTLVGLASIAWACDRILGLERGEPFLDRTGTGGAGTSGAGNGSDHTGAGDAAAALGGGANEPEAGSETGGPAAGGARNDAPGGGAGGSEGTACGSDSACPNPDPAHCSASCSGSGAERSCSVRSRDADRDGRRSASCTPDPGSDCNDDSAKTYPGAPELCDGLDNDCDGKVDLEDGLAVSGEASVVIAGDARRHTIAFSPGSSVFAAAWVVGPPGQEQVMVRVLPRDGEAALDETPVNPQPGLFDAVLAASPDQFAVAYTDRELGGVNLRVFSPDGAAASEPLPLTEEADPAGRANLALTYSDAGGWAVFWSDLGDVVARTVSRSGELGPIVNIGGAPNSGLDASPTRAVASGDSIFLVGPTTAIDEAFVLAPLLLGQSGVEISGYGNVAAARADGFGVAGRATAGGATFTSFTTSGARRCGPVPIPIPLQAEITDIAPSVRGYVVVTGQGGIGLVEVATDCRIVQVGSIDRPGAGVARIAAASEEGFGLLWAELLTDQTVLYRRFLGPSFCD